MGQVVDIEGRSDAALSKHADLIVRGIHCAGCVSKIERELSATTGVKSVRVNLSTSRLAVHWLPEKTDCDTIIKKLASLGFAASPYTVSEVETQTRKQLTFLLRCMAVAAFATMNVMLLSVSVWSGGGEMTQFEQTLLHWVSAIIAIPAIAYAGRPFFGSALVALRQKQTNMDVPISLAICLALGLSLYETIAGNPHTYFDAAVMLVFLLLIGRYLDTLMRAKSGDAARQLTALQVQSAVRLKADGQLETVPGTDIQIGDQIMVAAGQSVAVDGRIVEGTSEFDAKIVTGESHPRQAGVGDTVYSGMINLGRPVIIEAISGRDDSFLSEITRLVEAGEQSKSRYVQLADKAARAYVPVVHSLAALTFVGWILWGADFRHAAICAIAVLIITCPCALGLAVPAVNVVTSGRLFASGVLIRSGDVLERLSKVTVAIFDKTGTLTKGTAELSNADEIDPAHLQTAIALARRSNHPLSRTLAAYESNLTALDVEESPGSGVAGIVDGQLAKLGSAKWVGAEETDDDSQQCWVKIGDGTAHKLVFEDSLRLEAIPTIKALEKLGVESRLLSGDRENVTANIADLAGIDRFKGEVLPAEKMQIVEQLKSEAQYPLMIGDGINDAPSLAGAFVSASLASGSDVARSSSDIILQRDSLEALPETIRIARQSQARIKENLRLAVIYNILAVPLAIFGLVTPLIAALAMSGSSVLVTLNALRMRRS